MNFKLVLLVIQVALTVALLACGTANEDRYYDRKIYVYSDDPNSAGTQSADATAARSDSNSNTESGSGEKIPSNSASKSPEPAPQITGKGLIGAVEQINSSGKLTGWASVEADSSLTVIVSVLIDGVAIEQTILANLDSFDNNIPGPHAFAFEIAPALRDDKEHTIKLIAKHQDLALEFPEQKFKIAPPAANGQNFFLTNLSQNLQSQCGNCHPVNYRQQFASLTLPLPANGGTATNNELINMASGRNGNTNHPGGNICGNKNSGVCAQMQQWWTAEFVRN
jgi:hypothetical protein